VIYVPETLRTNSSDATAFDGTSSQVESMPPGPLRMAHQLLRGRYIWAVLLGICGAGLGAWGGYRAAGVTFRSRAAIRVLPTVPRVKVVDEEKGFLPMFEAYVQAQANLVVSERVRNAAMSDPAWVAVGRGASDQATLDFIKMTHVTHEGGFIFIDMIDRDPNAARIAAKAVTSAYAKIHSETDSKMDEDRMDKLEQLVNRQRAEYNSAEARVKEAIKLPGGGDDLAARIQSKTQELSRYDTDVNNLRLLLAVADSTTQPVDGATTQPRPVTIEDIARADPAMARLLNQRETLRDNLRHYRASGAGPNLPTINRAETELADLDTQIDALAKRVRDAIASSNIPNGRAQYIMRTRLQYEDLKKIANEVRQELAELSRVESELKTRRAEADNMKEAWDSTKLRIEQLKVERQISDRVAIVSDGERALEPYQDDRIRFAAGGGIGGGLLGLGMVLGIGLLDRRIRFADDAASRFGSIPLLGILPELPNQSEDPDQAALVSHCVHQIRGLLQIQGGAKNHHVFSVTSPVAGTGKTTLTHALGVSFAHANSRTLLIDCDIVGGGLSSRIDANIRRRLGRILRRNGRITPEQLNQALKLAISAKKPLGEMLMELGNINQADLAKALAMQQEEPMGLLDAIAGDDLRECIKETAIPGLSFLPLGRAGSEHVSQLSPAVVRSIIDQAKRRFDTILIDTGPIPGSLEAAVVAAAVDGVILAVSRGEQRPLAEQCIAHLNTLGARVVGIVFNRAAQKDIYASGTRYLSSTQVLLGSNRSPRAADVEGRIASSVVTAVATRAPNTKNASSSGR
jgi:succinoglycan biosynthesis transport protein ExoP